MYFVISSVAQMINCRTRKKSKINSLQSSSRWWWKHKVGALTSRGREGNTDKCNSSKPSQKKALYQQWQKSSLHATSRAPNRLWKNKQTKKNHNAYYWKRSKPIHDHSGGAGGFSLPLPWGEKNVDSHQNHRLPTHRKEKSLPNTSLILA